MSFNDAFYHCIMTATTIGLGDVAPQTQSGRLYGIFHMVASVIVLGSILGTILDGISRREAAMKKDEALARQLDVGLIRRLDKDGDGVDRTEFVLGMLEILGVVSKDDYEPFLKQFDRMDASGDGRLSADDLERLCESNAAEEQKNFRLAEEQESGKRKQMLEHARNLLVPTFLAGFAFLWNSLFGYLLMCAGFANDEAHSPLVLIALLAVVALCSMFSALALQVTFMISPMTYLSFDGVARETTFGTLDENGFSVMRPMAEQQEILLSLKPESTDTSYSFPTTVALFVLYQLTFVYAMVIDGQTAYCAVVCAREPCVSYASA